MEPIGQIDMAPNMGNDMWLEITTQNIKNIANRIGKDCKKLMQDLEALHGDNPEAARIKTYHCLMAFVREYGEILDTDREILGHWAYRNKVADDEVIRDLNRRHLHEVGLGLVGGEANAESTL